jgi:carotenoid cleavage dioxygenase-like enzyme
MTDTLDATTPQPDPWFVKGNFAPVQDELTSFDLPITGALPTELNGLYVRNGGNPKAGLTEHLFFGDGMLHGVRLDGGKATWYRNRYVRTNQLAAGLSTLDPASILDPKGGPSNTHVVSHAGRIWSLEEGHLPHEVGPELDTIGACNFDGKLTTAFTAHPKACPETGELHFFGYSGFAPFLTYHVLGAAGQLVHSAPITTPKGTMMHDFMITRDYAIFMDLPVVFDFDAMATRGAPFAWDDTYRARVGILPRMGTDADIRWFDVDPCYVFHPLNAYQDGSKIVCDVGRHEDMWRTSMEDFPPSYLHRWTFDLATGQVSEEQLDDVSHAFPRVDDRVVGLRHRYGWVVSPRSGSATSLDSLDAAGVVARYDLSTGEREIADLGPSAHPAEFVFAADPGATGEDEGWTMGYVYDGATGTSDLVVLDASRPAAGPVACIHLPQRVPFGFHGSWIADAH